MDQVHPALDHPAATRPGRDALAAWPRLSLRQMMVGVAAIAVLLPPPAAGIAAIAFGSLTCWMGVGLLVLLLAKLPRRLTAILGGVILVQVAARGLPTFAGWGLPPTHRAASLGLLLSTLVSMAGPPYLVWRMWRGRLPASGHLMWAWSGLVAPAPLFFQVSSHSSIYPDLCDLALLSAVVAVLLALYGARPADTGGTTAHHLGWLAMESIVIVWAVLAWRV